jgi:SAM-dependent MidA family methyltransferase
MASTPRASCLECAMPNGSTVRDDLPVPSPDAAAHSARLVDLIGREIETEGGWISFARFMELALYAPGLGYYSGGATKIGARVDDGSDFTTAPERTPLFAQALARPVAQLLRDGASSILEFGAGSGALARDLLRALETAAALPDRYDIVEVSGELRARQRATIESGAPHLAAHVRWLDAWPDQIEGVVLGNEVLDALPVRCIVRTEMRWLERGVELREQALAYADRPVGPSLSREIERALPDRPLPSGYETERHEALEAWTSTLVERMADDAVAILIDYGFPASEYFHPQRSGGTLMAHYRHRASPELLSRVGLQDLTAHVDFSTVARTVAARGGEVIGYTTQQSFLLDCGVADLIDVAGAADPRAWARHAAALQMLLSEAEMGELFKVMAIGKRPRAVRGFGRSDRRAAL